MCGSEAGMIFKEDLESLLVNNNKLHRIEAYLNRFNPIKVMQMEHQEIRHSAILAWLLDPRETHGFNDKFLRAFLCEAMRGQGGDPSALDISQADLRDAEVRREWQNIDIFILFPRLGWAFIVENKFHSVQHNGQLAKYAQKIKDTFELQETSLKVRGIFLTLNEEPPQDETYAPIQYSSICEILPYLMEAEAGTVRNDVAIFVNHYLEIIREAAGMSDERLDMEKLARQLYRSHKKALNFIIENGSTTDFEISVEAVVGDDAEYNAIFKVERSDFRFFWKNKYQFSFLPEAWIQHLGGDQLSWAGCENWWAGYPLICWCELHPSHEGASGRLRLIAEVGPLSDHEFRKALIEHIAGIGLKNVGFQKGATDNGKKYSRFLKGAEAHISDVQNIEEIERAIRAIISKFNGTFNEIAPVLSRFSENGYSE